MSIENFNSLSKEEALTLLSSCCTSVRWQEEVVKARPFLGVNDLVKKQELIWGDLNKDDYLEAFAGHPKIGDLSSLKKKYAHTKELANNEQSGVNTASEETLIALANKNNEYEEKFGYIFIVCASGKSANEMLDILNSRLDNDPEIEIGIAAGEQAKITQIRLEKIL